MGQPGGLENGRALGGFDLDAVGCDVSLHDAFQAVGALLDGRDRFWRWSYLLEHRIFEVHACTMAGP